MSTRRDSHSTSIVLAGVVVSLLSVLLAHAGNDSIGPWQKAELFAVPQHYPSDQFNVPGVTSILYQGLDYKGKETRFYAYYGVPAGEAPEGGWPAVVCVHGGGGTASAGQVKSWMEHGYSAIAMDLEGHLPKPGVPHNERPGHEWSGPSRAGNFDSGKISQGVPAPEHWFYHAVAGIVKAHSLLRSFPEINQDQIGIEGSSWGGVLTSLTIGIDPRFKFGITNTGCGFLQEGDSYLGDNFRRMKPDKRQVAIELYEPSTYIANAKLPMLWVNSTTDLHFPLNCTQKTALATSGSSTLWIKVGWGHARRPGDDTFTFANSVLKGGQPLPQRGDLVQKGKQWSVTFTSAVTIAEAELCYTTDTGRRSDRTWQAIPAHLDAGTASAELPEGTTAFFFNVIDASGHMASSLSRDFTE